MELDETARGTLCFIRVTRDAIVLAPHCHERVFFPQLKLDWDGVPGPFVFYMLKEPLPRDLHGRRGRTRAAYERVL